MLRTLVATALLAVAGAAFAQAPAEAPKGPRKGMHDCSQAKDPKACEERRTQFRDARKKAQDACAAKPQSERRDCMRLELCAQAEDPAKCEARAKERAERRKQRVEQNKK